MLKVVLWILAILLLNVEPPNCSWYCDCRIVNPVVFEEMS